MGGRILALGLVAALAGCSGGAGGGPGGAPGEDEALVSGSPEVETEIAKALSERAFPGASIAIGTVNRVLYLRGFGGLEYGPASGEVTPDTVYDLASVTKAVATTTAAMLLVDDGRLRLDDPVARWIPEARTRPAGRATIRQLLEHRAGLPKWLALYRDKPADAGPTWLLERILAAPIETPGKVVYSDIGMILAGMVLARAAREDLDAFLARRLFAPLGMETTMYRPPAHLLARIAPTEDDTKWRGRVVRGEVHDENAAAMGGVAGHAGLFSTARDLSRFAGALLAAHLGERGPFPVRSEIVRAFTTPAEAGATRLVGWDRATKGGASGSHFSASAFGHTGFTGTSIWIDPEARFYVVLLTNRVHPTRDNQKIHEIRRRVHDAAVRDWRRRLGAP